VYDDKCEMVFTTGSPDSNQAYRWAGGHNTSAINGQTREPKLAFVTGRTWSSNVIGVDQLTTNPRTPLAKPGSARSEEYDSQVFLRAVNRYLPTVFFDFMPPVFSHKPCLCPRGASGRRPPANRQREPVITGVGRGKAWG
jgi:hypothetical protein